MLKSMLKLVTLFTNKKILDQLIWAIYVLYYAMKENMFNPFSWTLFLTCAYIYPLEIQNHQRTIA